MRLLGSVLVLGATLWFGAYFAAKEKYRLQELAELERAILLLQSQIAYLSAPLTEVLESVSWKAEGVIGEIFAQAAAVMAERERAFCGGNLDRGMVEAAESDFPDGGGFGYGAFLWENPRLSG